MHRAIVADWFGITSYAVWNVPREVLVQSVEAVLRLAFTLTPLTGFVIGAITLGGEFGKQTLPFLLTRPRHRWYYLWSSWLVGAVEVLTLIFVGVVLYGTRLQVPGFPRSMEVAGLLKATLAMAAPAAVIYCLTFCFAVLLKKEQHGTNAAVATVFSYSGLVLFFRLMYEVRIPVFWEFYAGAFDASRSVPWVAFAGWLGLALLLIVVAHSYFERVEV